MMCVRKEGIVADWKGSERHWRRRSDDSVMKRKESRYVSEGWMRGMERYLSLKFYETHGMRWNRTASR